MTCTVDFNGYLHGEPLSELLPSGILAQIDPVHIFGAGIRGADPDPLDNTLVPETGGGSCAQERITWIGHDPMLQTAGSGPRWSGILEFSRQPATALRTYIALPAEAGADPDICVRRGFGETEPFGANLTPNRLLRFEQIDV